MRASCRIPQTLQGDPVAVAEGGAATYTVALDGEPTGNVVVTLPSDNADGTA